MARLLPARLWYRAALCISRCQNLVLELTKRLRPVSAPGALDLWLLELSRFGPYPIPYRATGLDVIETSEPKLYFSPHVTFHDIGLRAMVEHCGGKPLHVVGGAGRIEADGCCTVAGLEERAPGIRADILSLLRMRSLLRAGHSVGCMADPMRGGELSETPLEMARLTGALVILSWAELEPDGTFAVSFQKAPRPHVRSAEDIRINMDAVRELQQRDLQRVLC